MQSENSEVNKVCNIPYSWRLVVVVVVVVVIVKYEALTKVELTLLGAEIKPPQGRPLTHLAVPEVMYLGTLY